MTDHVSPDLISEWLDRQSRPRDAEWVGRHLESCDACRSIAAELSSVDEMFRAAEAPELPSYLWTRIEARLQEDRTVSRFGGRFPLRLPALLSPPRQVFALALCATLIIAGSVFMIRYASPDRDFELAMAEIDQAQIEMASLQPARFNPFSHATDFDAGVNPFTVRALDIDSNPFQSAPDGR